MTLTGLLTSLILLLVVAVAAVAGYYAFITWRFARRAELLVPPPGRFAEIDGNRIHIVERGQGRPILFVHGLGGTQFHFTYPLFSRLESDFRLIAMDRPGSGYSTRRRGGPETPAEHAAFIARLIDELDLEKPLVVGHSLGGAIALALAIDYPDKLSGLALIAPLTRHIRNLSPEFAGLYIRSPLLRWLIAYTVSTPNAIKLAPKTLEYVYGPQQPPADNAIAGGALSLLRPSHFYATSTDFVAVEKTMPEQETRYGELALPVGVFFGTADRVVNFEQNGSWLQGRIAGLELEALEGVGHMPHYAEGDKAEAFIRRMATKAFGA
ncbi:MAG: alpha/beta fold hydrolase [Rhizobiaceae bacterium]|nr:alpha/beta fold hydrolase [Rhizobiaceae bacterium]